MQVYKATLKIIKKNLPVISIYIAVFLLITVIQTLDSTSPKEEASFAESKPQVMILNQDNDHAWSQEFQHYLETKVDLISNIPESQYKDALFYQDVDYILTIPLGFGQNFLQQAQALAEPSLDNPTISLKKETTIDSNLVKLQSQSLPNSTAKIQIDLLIQRYLEVWQKKATSLASAPAANQTSEPTSEDLNNKDVIKKISQQTSDILDLQIDTHLLKPPPAKGFNLFIYFNYMCYALLSALILGTASIMKVFSQKDLTLRNNCSAKRKIRFLHEIFLGVLTLGVATWLLLVLTGLFFARQNLTFSLSFWLLLVNSFIFSLATLSLGFLLSQLIQNSNGIQAANTILGLGMCFFGGVFIPRDMLDPFVVKASSFTPVYWYVSVNGYLENFSQNLDLKKWDIFQSLFMQLLFAVAFIVLAIVVNYQKKSARN